MAEENMIYELGVDIDSSLTFVDGDLKLAEYDDNLVQAITRRLKTNLDELDLFYDEYGSVLMNFFGWKGVEAISFIKSELETVLKAEPRILNWSYDVQMMNDGVMKIDLALYPNPGYVINTSFVVNNEGVEVI